MKKCIVFCFIVISTFSIYGTTGKELSRLMIHVGSGVTSLDNKPVISFNGDLTFAMTSRLNLGMSGSVFHTLEREYTDSSGKTYQAESATTEIFLQPHWAFDDKWDMGIKLGTGIQLVQFRYEEALRDTLVWTDELLDKLEIPSLSASVTLQYSVCPLHSLQMEFGYRHLKDTVSQFTDQNQIQGSFFGTLQYGFRI